MKRVNRASFIPVEIPHGRLGREVVVDGRTSAAGVVVFGGGGGRGGVSGGGGVFEGVRDEEGISVCFVEIAAFGVRLEGEGCEEGLDAGGLGGGGGGVEDG